MKLSKFIVKTGILGTALLLVLLAGCSDMIDPVPSIHPLYRDGESIMEKSLLGTWALDSKRERWAQSDCDEYCRKETLEFLIREDNTYLLRHETCDLRASCFIANLIEIGGKQFLDVYPDFENSVTPVGTYLNYFGLHPLHGYFYVEQIEPELILRELEYQWIEDLLETDPAAIRHESIPDEDGDYRILLTASAVELQAFCLANCETEGAFESNENRDRTFVRIDRPSRLDY